MSLSYERKRFLFCQMARCHGLMGCWNYTKEERQILSFIQKGLYEFQAAMHCFSLCICFARMKEGITKLQAVYRTESLVFVVHQDMELMETVLKLYATQIECIQEHCKKDEENNLDLFI
jgi:hypothetical protein